MDEMVDLSTGEIVGANDAWNRSQRIIELKNNIGKSFIMLGQELFFFEKEKQYLELDYKTFEQYLGDPDVDIQRRTAFMLKGIYEDFIHKLKVQPVALFEIEYSKLDVIRPYVDEQNVDEWLAKARNLSRTDLRYEITESLSENLDADIQIDRAEELLQKWQCEVGQVWKIGEHRLVCGDSTDANLLSLALNGYEPNVIITDPPYGMNLDTDYSKMPSTKPEGNKTYSPIIGDDKPFDYQSVILRCDEEFWFGADYYCKSIPDGGSWLVWDKRVEPKFDAMIGSAFELIWSKQKHKREFIRHNNTLFSGEAEAKNKLHPTMKPTKVIEWIVDKYSRRGQTIVDLYSGTGSTILACENLGRKCVAIELDPKYVAVTLERLLDAIHIEPVLGGQHGGN